MCLAPGVCVSRDSGVLGSAKASGSSVIRLLQSSSSPYPCGGLTVEGISFLSFFLEGISFGTEVFRLGVSDIGEMILDFSM